MAASAWTNNDLLTDPQRIQIATTETAPISWDMTAIIGGGESLSNPAVVVTQVHPKPIAVVVDAIVSGSIGIDSTNVEGTLDGSELVRGRLYEILVTADLAVGKTLSVMTMLECLA